MVFKLLQRNLKNQERSRTKKDWKAKKTLSDEKFLRVSSLRGQKKSSKDLAQHLAVSSGCQVDPSTFRRSLIRNGLCGRVAAKKPSSQRLE